MKEPSLTEILKLINDVIQKYPDGIQSEIMAGFQTVYSTLSNYKKDVREGILGIFVGIVDLAKK